MIVRATSDLHGYMPKVQPCDVLIIAGDVCPIDQSHDVAHQAKWLEDTFSPWLESIPAKHIVAVGGNHDFALEDEEFARSLPWTYLLDEEKVIEGAKFYGSPWVPHLPSWAFYQTDEQLEKTWAKLPEDVDIVITHSPPYGKADRVGFEHVGSDALRSAIQAKKPQIVVCGHIHEGFGMYMCGDTEIYNVAYVDEYYDPNREIILI